MNLWLQVICSLLIVEVLRESVAAKRQPFSLSDIKEKLIEFLADIDPSGRRRLVKVIGEPRAGKAVILYRVYVLLCIACGYSNVLILANLESANKAIPGVTQPMKRFFDNRFKFVSTLVNSVNGGPAVDRQWSIFDHTHLQKRQNSVEAALNDPTHVVVAISHLHMVPLKRLNELFCSSEQRVRSSALAVDEIHNTMSEEDGMPKKEQQQLDIMYVDVVLKKLRFDFTMWTSGSQVDVDAYLDGSDGSLDHIDVSVLVTDNEYLRANGFVGMVHQTVDIPSGRVQVGLAGVKCINALFNKNNAFGRKKLENGEYTLSDTAAAIFTQIFCPPPNHHFAEKRIAIEFGVHFVDGQKNDMTVGTLASSVGNYYKSEILDKDPKDLLVISHTGAGCKVVYASEAVASPPTAKPLHDLMKNDILLEFKRIYIVTNGDTRGCDFNHLGGGHKVSHVIISCPPKEIWYKTEGLVIDVQRAFQMLGRAFGYVGSPLVQDGTYAVIITAEEAWECNMAFVAVQYKEKLPDLDEATIASFAAMCRHGGAKIGKDSHKQRKMNISVSRQAPVDFRNRAKRSIRDSAAPPPPQVGSCAPLVVS